MKVLGLLSLLLCISTGAARGESIEEGRHFPDLRLPTLGDGQLRAVSDFAGKKTLLIVFASW